MSFDWGAVADGLGWVGIGLMVLGMVAQTVVGASLRWRPRAAAVGAAMLGAGLFVISTMAPAAESDPLTAVGCGVAVILLIIGARANGKLLRALSLAGAGSLLWLVDLRKDWIVDGDVTPSIVMAVTIAATVASVALLVWLHRKLKTSKPRRDAHA